LRNYRDRFDIIADILQIAKRNPKKTQIMYQANLSYKVFKKYLNELLKADLILYIEPERCYALTNKGKEFLVFYSEYYQANIIVNKKLEDVQNRKEILEKLCDSKDWKSLKHVSIHQ